MVKASKPISQPSAEVPVFLRKTYHMIDSCDPKIASWSPDGKTFVVKDPACFERSIIPQFFKHNKFTSFVRQLNFYQFRKIKYVDSIRIDLKLEAETANYWRFRHEYFQRGRPDLLPEIKRLNGSKGTPPSTEGSSEEKVHSSEVQSLKQRIEEMSKNIDQLTAMVNKVSIKQEECSPEKEVGEKRKKIDHSTYETQLQDCRPDEMFSSMDLEKDLAILPGVTVSSAASPDEALSSPSSVGLTGDINGASRVCDDDNDDYDYVDELFSAFAEDTPPEPAQVNHPDPELMKRLGDALMLLPHEIQVMIVDRLVSVITGSEITPLPQQVPSIPHSPAESSASSRTSTTLAALLHHCSAHVEGKQPKSVASKTIPVIPVHA